MLFGLSCKVPRLLGEKVRSYYNYVVEREVQADEADIIAGLSASLRTQVRHCCSISLRPVKAVISMLLAL